MEEFDKLAIKANYVPGMVDPKTLDKVTRDMQQNFPPSPFTTAQASAIQATKPQENSAPSVTTPTAQESTPEKTEPEKTKFSIRAILPIASYHMNRHFRHALHQNEGTWEWTKYKDEYGLNSSKYEHKPGYQHYDEFNPGFGLEVSKDRSDNYTKTFNWDALNIKPFVVGFKNSYNDTTVSGGVNWTPVIAKFDTKQLGTFLAELGVTAGMAYTANGTYRYDGPTIGRDFTFLGMGLLTVHHEKTGLGIQLNGLPPIGGHDGVLSFALSKKFKNVFGL